MTEPTPDGVPCRHCGQPIFWDEVCWVHGNGWADCGLTMSEGTKTIGSFVINPKLTVDPKYKGAHAEPVGEWS